MKLAPARQAAFAALLAVSRGAWSAESLAAKSTHLEPRDAALASDIVYGVLRRRGELDAEIARFSRLPLGKLDPAVKIALEMAVYQMRFLDRVPAHAAVNDAVELVRRAGKQSAAAFTNAILRKASTAKYPSEDTLLSTPEWLRNRWRAQYGEAIASGIAQASLETPGRYIRVGTGDAPAGAVPTDVPGCYTLPEGDPQGFRFQDIGSQSVVPLLDLRPGLAFLDVCAAPGNKTAQALESGVKAIACELHLSRARGLTLGIPVVVADATRPLPFSRRFDRILVDAPCSGTGTLARNPEIKWNLKSEDIADLARRQKAILRNALDLLARGGVLVYSTCSLESEENQDVIAGAGAEVRATMQRLPGRDPGDGFFAAVLSR